jgi:hypothetical protein
MPAGITRANRTVLDSQGAFVAGNTRRTVRRTPTNCFGIRSSRLGAFGPRAAGGRLELWWCTPTTSGSRASRGRSRRQRRPRSFRERRAHRAVFSVSRRIETAPLSERHPKGGTRAAPRKPKPRAESWPSGLPTARGDGRRSSWIETTCADPASPRIEPGPLLERRPKGGSLVAARGLKLLARRWSSGRPRARCDDPLVTRRETTRADLRRCGPSRVRHLRRAPSRGRRGGGSPQVGAPRPKVAFGPLDGGVGRPPGDSTRANARNLRRRRPGRVRYQRAAP